MRNLGRWWVLSWISVTFLCAPPAVRADAKDEARILFEAGIAASRAERWEEASEYFERSLRLAEKASTWFNLAVAELKLKHGSSALKALDAFESLAGREHSDMKLRARELRGTAWQLAAEEEDDEPVPAPVAAPSSPVPAPETTVSPTPVPPAPAEEPLRVPAAGPSAEHSPLRPPRIMLTTGLLTAGAAVGTLLWWSNRSEQLERCEARAAECTTLEANQREERAALGVSVALSVAAAGLITSGAIWLSRERKQTSAMDVSATLTRERVAAQLTARF
jgi:tetratricopeptide (TPR) repeat protein